MLSLLMFLSLLPFQLPEYAGPLYSSAEHANGVFLVEAYFNTCPYCNQNAENVNDLADDYKANERVQVLDVGIDKNDSDYKSWVNKHQPNHPVLMDPRKELIRKLGTSGYPSTYVIGCDGEVIYETSGVWSSAKKQRIHEAVESGLKLNCREASE